jgi:hypothetical protein
LESFPMVPPETISFTVNILFAKSPTAPCSAGSLLFNAYATIAGFSMKINHSKKGKRIHEFYE